MGGYADVFKRKEVKYLLSKDQYNELMVCLEKFARIDEYGLTRINNIYYDTPDYRLIRNSLEKPLYKEKLRLRTYGETKKDTNAFIEIKKKYEGIVYKRRIPGRYENLHDYLTTGDYDIGNGQIEKEIKAFIGLYGKLIPAMSICYDRIALAGIKDKDFRVTFDSALEWNSSCRDLKNIRPGRRLLKPDQYLMEIKVLGALPVELSKRLSELKIFPASFSKYGAGYIEMISSRPAMETSGFTVLNGTFNGSHLKGGVAYA